MAVLRRAHARAALPAPPPVGRRPGRARPACAFSVVHHDPPVESLNAEFPLRLTTGRRLDSYNTGVQSGAMASPLRLGETIDVSAADAEALGLCEGEIVRVSSRRGSVEAPVRVDLGLRPGLVFMTFHFAGRRRRQPAHDRSERPPFGHRRVQGRRRADRPARAGVMD